MVLVIALIVLGPDKLPRVARQLGAAWRELTRFREHVEQEVRAALPDVDLPRIPTRPSSAVASFLSDLTAPLTAPLADPSAAGGGTVDTDSESDEAGGARPEEAPAAAALNGAGELAGEPASNGHAVPADDRRAPAWAGHVQPPERGPLTLDGPFVAPDDPSMN